MSKMYYQGETMQQKVEVRETNGALVDADTIVITIVDPEDTEQVSAEAMINDSTGKYYYNYLIAADAEKGEWKTEVKAMKGFTAIEQDEFTVMEAL